MLFSSKELVFTGVPFISPLVVKDVSIGCVSVIFPYHVQLYQSDYQSDCCSVDYH